MTHDRERHDFSSPLPAGAEVKDSARDPHANGNGSHPNHYPPKSRINLKVWLSEAEALINKHPNLSKGALFVLCCLVMIGSAAYFYQRGNQPPVAISAPKPKMDPAWLTDPNWIMGEVCSESGCRRRTIADAREQMHLWLTNTNTDIGSPGVLVRENNREAQRYRAAVYQYQNTPNHPCYKKPEQACYQSFVPNILEQLNAATTPGERQGALNNYLALDKARFDAVEAPGTPDSALTLRIIEKFESDLATYYQSQTLDGVVKERSEAEADAQNGYQLNPSVPSPTQKSYPLNYSTPSPKK